MTKKTRNTLVLLVKLAVAAALLTYLFATKFHWNDYTTVVDGQQRLCKGLRGTLASANRWLLAASFACFALPLVTMAVRWWCLLRVQKIRISLWESGRLTLLGTFFGYVVPGLVSGDLIKAYYVAKHTDRKAAALVSIFVDRAVGLLQFAIMPAVVLALLFVAGRRIEHMGRLAVVVGVVLAGVLAGRTLLLSSALRRALRLDRLLSRLPLRRQLRMAGQADELYRRRLPTLLQALGITFVGQGICITAIMLAGFALLDNVPWHQYFLYVPLIYIVLAVPVTPGGWGVMEGLFVMFFASGAGGDSQAIALALVSRLFPMAWSLPGVVVAVTGPKLPRPEQMQAELADAAPRQDGRD